MQEEIYWSGHRERLRRRVEEQGWDEIKDFEIVELILYYAVPRQDLSDLARELMKRFGSLRELMRAGRRELMAVPGVTRVMADWLMMTADLTHMYLRFQRGEKEQLFCFRDVLRFLVPRWRAVHPPECWMVYTDFSDNLMTYSVLCDSLSWYEPEYVCEVVNECTALDARHAVLVCYVGVLPLEVEDDVVTHLIEFSRTLRAIDVELLDCVLVGESGFYSMNMDGRFDVVRAESEDMSVHEDYVRGERRRDE